MDGAQAEGWIEGLELFGMRFGLERMHSLMQSLGQPLDGVPVVHVVGTNGKSSVTRMTAAILTAHGLRTGAYVSPHVIGWRERVALDARPLAADDDLPIGWQPEVVERLAQQFDARLGGFGRAPKFPQAMTIDLLLRSHVRTGDDATLRMALTSLDAMAAGGIHDHLGGGFARYSTDDTWLVPHFEKMLYDQATLLAAYTHAYQVTGADHLRRVIESTVGYVLRDLATDGPGWASAEDADSEGIEGRFYLWSPDDVAAVCVAGASELPSSMPIARARTARSCTSPRRSSRSMGSWSDRR